MNNEGLNLDPDEKLEEVDLDAHAKDVLATKDDIKAGLSRAQVAEILGGVIVSNELLNIKKEN